MRGPSKFKKTDVTRAARGLLAAGVDIARLEIEPVSGKVSIITGSSSDDQETNDLDNWIAKDARDT